MRENNQKKPDDKKDQDQKLEDKAKDTKKTTEEKLAESEDERLDDGLKKTIFFKLLYCASSSHGAT